MSILMINNVKVKGDLQGNIHSSSVSDYYDNPDVNVHEVVKLIFDVCGVEWQLRRPTEKENEVDESGKHF